ncbi:MAG TPA: transglutaminase family protein [Turneriella sp.]|nr:transglutaminase family protein [Turneriella sp.]
MPLRSHNILALLIEIGKDLANNKNLATSQAFMQLIATEASWAEIFQNIDAVPDFALRHKLRTLEIDYTTAFVYNQLGHVLPRSNNDVYAIERISYLTGLLATPFKLWDEYCAALDSLEVDLRQRLESVHLTPRRVKGRFDDLKIMHEILSALNETIFEKNGISGSDNAINCTEAYSPQAVLCERIPGIPLSIAMIYLIAGLRLGFPIYGVNTPARFLVKWQYGNLELFINVFDRGTVIDRDKLDQLMRENFPNYSNRLLDAVPFEIIARRAIANTAALAARNEDYDRSRKLEALSRTLFGF